LRLCKKMPWPALVGRPYEGAMVMRQWISMWAMEGRPAIRLTMLLRGLRLCKRTPWPALMGRPYEAVLVMGDKSA
jgi:hypothetical protein